VEDAGQGFRRTMQPRRTRSKKGLSAQDSSRCRRTWIVSTSSYEASSITRPCREHAHGLFSSLPATAGDACCTALAPRRAVCADDGEAVAEMSMGMGAVTRTRVLMVTFFDATCLCCLLVLMYKRTHDVVEASNERKGAGHHLAVGVPEVVVVRQLLVGARALVLAVLPGQRPPVAVAGRGGGGRRRGRGRRAPALVAALRQAVVAVAVRSASTLLPAGLGDGIGISSRQGLHTIPSGPQSHV